MSTETAEEHSFEAEDVLAAIERYGHYVVVGFLMLFMFWVRVLNYGAFTTDDGTLRLSAVDSWYHWRATEWTIENYPRTMPYEVYTGFPTGRYVGQFGTLFDQIVATVAMIIGLGDPSQGDIHTAAMLTVPALAALVAIPVYLIATRVSDGNRIAGLVAVIIIALTPGSFLTRSTAGQFQHHVAEVLFMSIAILAVIVALRVAERDRPIWELIDAREWEPLKAPAKYSLLAGLALSLYLWTWPPGVMLLGILGVFFAVHLCIEFIRGVSPDHVAFVGAISLAVPALFMLAMLEEPSTSVTSFGLLQPVVGIMVAVGCLFMAWFARVWSARRIDPTLYPGAIVAIGIVGLLALYVLLPDIISSIVDNVNRRILPIGASETDLTIQEAAPPTDPGFIERATREFGLGLYLMVIGLGLIAVRPFVGRRLRAEHTLIVVWALFLTSMAMTQIRFWYYFILPVAIVSGYTIAQVIELVDLDRANSLRDVQTYQVLVAILVLMVLFVPFAPMFNDVNAVSVGEGASPHPDSFIWEDSNEFMAENTPELGNLYGAGNEDELEYYERYSYPEDGDFDYPEGAYGVMSWWDYGHLITTQAERIPHSNPFQQNARSSSAFLQAQGEERGEAALDLIAEGESPRLDETGELTQQPTGDADLDEEIRYVMIDYQMAGSKFPAIVEWTGPTEAMYIEEGEFVFQGEETPLQHLGDAYYDTMLASLYLEDAEGMEHYRLVHETDQFAYVGGALTEHGPNPRASFDLGLPAWQDEDEDFDGMQWAASVEQTNQQNAVSMEGLYNGHIVSAVKTFERVEGATIEGSVADVEPENASEFDLENATGVVALELETEPGRTFLYTQEFDVDEDGSFDVTVPYATTEELGPEDGYTESTVLATDSYEISVNDGESFFNDLVDVEEPAIYDGATIETDLEEFDPEANGEGNETNGDDDDADGENNESNVDEGESDGNENEANGDTGGHDDGDDDDTVDRIGVRVR